MSKTNTGSVLCHGMTRFVFMLFQELTERTVCRQAYKHLSREPDTILQGWHWVGAGTSFYIQAALGRAAYPLHSIFQRGIFAQMQEQTDDGSLHLPGARRRDS